MCSSDLWIVLLDPIVGMCCGYVIMRLVYHVSKRVLKREALGFGDVRLVGCLGVYVGFTGFPWMLTIGCCLASIYGLILYKQRKVSTCFPLGPFLCMGAWMMIFGSEWVMKLYP